MKVVRRDPNKAYIDGWLWIPKRLVNVLAVQSALQFSIVDRKGEETILCLWRESQYHLLVPRAFWDVRNLACDVIDCRPQKYLDVDFKSRIELDHRIGLLPDGTKALLPTGDNVQRLSIDALDRAQGGVLQLACGKGKTVVAIEHIARTRQPALIVIPDTNLIKQWEAEINALIDVPGGIGEMYGGKFDWKKNLVLATYHTVANRAEDMPEEVRRHFGIIIWDEGHHINAPTFAATAHAFYGRRYLLTATPERDDGYHVIAQVHIGGVVHKDLRPALKSSFIFEWTGLTLDMTDPSVVQAVTDTAGEVHLRKVSTYVAAYRPFLQKLWWDTNAAMQAGRKTLVLSDGVALIANMMALWTDGPNAHLFTDIPEPTPEDIGETLQPLDLSERAENELKNNIAHVWELVHNGWQVNQQMNADINEMMRRWMRHLVRKKLDAELVRRQKRYIKELVKRSGSSRVGLMTHSVGAEEMQRFLKEKSVVFAITKYGKEGLNCQELDTVLVADLFSAKGGLQQLMGRPTRPMPGKKSPLCGFYVHNIPECIGMATKLQQHLRAWPTDQGGPLEFERINFPRVKTCKFPNMMTALQQS